MKQFISDSPYALFLSPRGIAAADHSLINWQGVDLPRDRSILTTSIPSGERKSA